MYKIFINDKPLFLVDSDDTEGGDETNLWINYVLEDDLTYGIEAIERNENLASVTIFNNDLQSLWKSFQSRYKIIVAAGGLVKNLKDEYLLIFRNGKWDIPKGKLEKAENPDVAALREVEEECGITNMIIEGELPNTYHTYELKGSPILKISHWYTMSYSGDEKLVPQLNEGIQKAEWLNSEQIREALTNSYSSVQEMLRSKSS